MFGHINKLIRVNLTESRIFTENLDRYDLKEYIGGSGLAAKIIFDELDPSVDPLSPENILLFMTGPLTGTASPSCGRYCVCTKSPLTGLWAESHAAGFWGPELKFSGYDGIIIKGRSDSPVYLSIIDGKIELRNASKLWGADTYQTEEYLKDELEDQSLKVASFVQAGDNGVLFA